ncbi:DNA-binding protein [Saccharothrix violaceirubra]|uniref:DNA-binding protein n=1 Tax=Saccharothrix violaceirubra TaxID=413306 RepID=A0A7W7WVC2_9PSEU|nr:hypothetical protein [Saccharothrix violaceirubra]MBB4965179.1 hypothetical protein [Saccharothrix violaceirubra]
MSRKKDQTSALLSVGAILPGTRSKGDDRDTLTARRYTHPGLGERAVVRLVPATLGQAEDLTCEFLGFGTPERTPSVGTARRVALGFPAWALVNDPANAHHALNLVKEVERLARTAKSRAGAAKDGFTQLGTMLGRSAPHFLPTFYEQAGRIFIEHNNHTYAASMFGKAREAEEVHDLDVDPQRLREVFLEFAFAGALTAKALSAQSKGLTRRHDPDDAYELFFTLCVERTRGGLPPYTGMPEDLRRLAKVAKRDLKAEDERVLRAVLDSSAISRAGAGFWKSYRDSLIGLAKRDAGIRALLLTFVPNSASLTDQWLEILESGGSTAVLVADEAVEGAPVPAEWLSSLLNVRMASWHGTPRSEALLDLVDRMAPRLVADDVPVRVLRRWWQGELDLLDLFALRGVPIAESKTKDVRLNVEAWLEDERPGRRDLVALAAHPDLGRALGTGLVIYLRNHQVNGIADPERLAPAVDVPGLRTALRDWITAHVDEAVTLALPGLDKHMDVWRPLRLPAAFADVPEAADKLAAVDVGAALHHTLRTGLVDELGWPALDEAVEKLEADNQPGKERVTVVGEGWPALVVRRGDTLVVAGPDGILAEHVVRIPPARRHSWSFLPYGRWFDGTLLVRWRNQDGEDEAYWSDAPDTIFHPSDETNYYGGPDVSPSILLPDGSRFNGRRAVRPGDTGVRLGRAVRGDGTSLWALTRIDWKTRWVEVDPATGESGRQSLPRFVEEFAADGTTLDLDASDLRPAVAATAASPLGLADGLHGWRVRQQADESWLGEGVDGRRATAGPGNDVPVGVLTLPGSELVLTRENDTYSLRDRAGVVLGTVSPMDLRTTYAAGTPLVAPFRWWHLLRPRDEAGSAALRALSRETVDELLEVAVAENSRVRTAEVDPVAEKAFRDRVAALLPAVTDARLLAGVVEVVRRAGSLLWGYREFGVTAEQARAVDLSSMSVAAHDVTTTDLSDAVGWFNTTIVRESRGTTRTAVPELLAALTEAVANPVAGPLPDSLTAYWYPAVPVVESLAHRAVSPLVPDRHRDALLLLLRSLADSALFAGTGKWRTVTVVVPENTPSPRNRVTPVGDGFLALLNEQWLDGRSTQYHGLQYSVAGTFELPAKWTASTESRFAEHVDRAWLTRLLDTYEERGPVPWHPGAVEALAEPTGMTGPEAAIVLAGMPGVERWDAVYMTTEHRRLIGLSQAEAKAGRQRLKPLSDDLRRHLLAAAVPSDPADLWTSGPDVASLAAMWNEFIGQRLRVPDEIAVEASKVLPMRDSADYLVGVLDPENTHWLTSDRDMFLGERGLESRNNGFGSANLLAVPQVLLWLAHRLPGGSPLRAALPRALELARQRVADPGFALELGRWEHWDSLRGALDAEPPADGTQTAVRDWLIVERRVDNYCTVVVRPGLVGPGDRELLVAVMSVTSSTRLLGALDLVAAPGTESACAASLPEGADPESYFQDPTVSAPHLVGEVAAKTGLSEDAAVLYLQLLAMPDPTDANVARWTGWKPARLRAAREALAATDLVLTAKRARAGRTLFLPGGWEALSTPHLPLESWKLPFYSLAQDRHWTVITPREPAGELFARAWQRVVDGDAPAYEELRTGRRR